MDSEQTINSHLFMVRVWVEEAEEGQFQYRGKVHHIPSDEIRYFRGWAALMPLMLDMLHRHPNPQANEQNGDH